MKYHFNTLFGVHAVLKLKSDINTKIWSDKSSQSIKKMWYLIHDFPYLTQIYLFQLLANGGQSF